MTLPLIHTLQHAQDDEKNILIDLLKGDRQERLANLDQARDIIERNNGFTYARRLAESLINEAIGSLAQFSNPAGQIFRETLVGLAHYVLSRDK